MRGFEVFNDAGFKIAGSDYPNLVFYGKGVLTTTNYDVNGPGFDGHSYIGSAVLPVDGGTVRFLRSLGGHHAVEDGGRLFSDVVGAQFEYYSFGPCLADSGTSGIEVYGENNQLTFSTTRPFLKLAGVYIDTRAVGTPDTGNDAYSVQTPFSASGRTYAFLFSNAHVAYKLYRFADRPYSVSYETVRAANLTPAGVFSCKYISRYQWTHTIERRQVREVANREANQRVLIADVTGL